LDAITSIELIAGILFLYYSTWVIYSRFFHPYHDIPGPFLASITEWWYFGVIRYDKGDSQLPLHQKYGKFVRIAPNEVSICDAGALDTVYGSNPIYQKTEFYDSFSPRIGDSVDVFTVRDEKVHAIARRKLAPLFTPGAILEYEPCVERIIKIFCQRLDAFAISGDTVDISHYFRKYSFDAIGEIFYGKENGFGFLLDDIDYMGWMGMLDVMVSPVSSLAYIPKGMRTLYLMLQLATSAQTRLGLQSANKVIEQAKAVVKEREDAFLAGNKSTRKDMLSKLMDMAHSEDEKSDFTLDDVASTVWMMIWGGSDTTGYAICSIFYYVLKHPDVCRKLEQEITDALDAGKLSLPIRYNDAVKLPYLNACIKEGMRISPSFGLGLPRYVPKGGAVIAGRYFPEGYRVIMNQNAVHFDKECFGDDAEEFVPERWLQGDKEKLASMARHDMGFGLGPRVCLGKHVSDALS
jgi:cytochrome P450